MERTKRKPRVRRKRWKGYRLNEKGKRNLEIVGGVVIGLASLGYILMGLWLLWILITR